MRRRYVLVGFALLIALAAALPALGAPSPLSFAKAALERAQKADRTAHKANRKAHQASSSAHKANRTSSKALRTARRASKKAAAVTTRTGPTGPTGPTGAAGLAGTARAYGMVGDDGTLDSGRSKNVVGVTHTVGTGSYCIALSGDVNPGSSGVVAIIDLSDSTAGPIVQWDKTGAACAPGQLDIETRQILSSSPGTPVVEAPADQGFFFAVP